MQQVLPLTDAELRGFCQRWHIRELALFGSAGGADFTPESDFDILVTFGPDAEWSLLDHIRMQAELSELVGRPVDLVSRQAIEHSRNPFRKREILGTARSIYVAG